jgi:predicted dehydrogenase/nucleoside-diphosphate-sugar epimerase
MLRIGLIGCGAIASAHARAIALTPSVSCSAVCDVDIARAQRICRTFFPKATVFSDPAHLIPLVDAAIVAVPNLYHARVSIPLLNAGVHVLCEKPLAQSTSDAEEMLKAAKQGGAVLTCGFVRRYYGSTALVGQILERGLIGKPIRFRVTESVTNWPFSRVTFDAQFAGGGVLIDMAPHVFDLIQRWFGPVEILRYEDDNCDGVEAVARVLVRCNQYGRDVSGDIFLSRAHATRNRTRIYCERGYIEVDPHKSDSALIVFDGELNPFKTTAELKTINPFVQQLQGFIATVRVQPAAAAAGREAAAVVRLIDQCYSRRMQLPEPWYPIVDDSTGSSSVFGYKKVLVTGSTGAVGLRLLEMWAARGLMGNARCMIRGHSKAARLKRFSVETVDGNLLDFESVRKAAAGCDAIIHLGVGSRAYRETLSVLAAARKEGIRRFVHMSTAAVYGAMLPSSIDRHQEETKIVRTGEPYADEKARAEQAVLHAGMKGLEVVVLRPHIVYGPFLRWSSELLELLAADRISIIEDGGWCNLVYIDDLVRAIDLALAAKQGLSKPMFITDGQPITWRGYIMAHASEIGVCPRLSTRAKAVTAPRSFTKWLADSIAPLGPVVRSKEFRNFVFNSPAVQATAFRAYLGLQNFKLFKAVVDRLRSSAPSIESHEPESNALWNIMQLS